MKLVARELPLAANPLRLASRLAGESHLVVLWSACGTGPSYLAVRPVAQSHEIDLEPTLRACREPNELGRVPRWIGLVPYESRRALERPGLGLPRDDRETPHLVKPIWWRFGAVVCIGERVSVVGDDAASVD